jgi:hypothetical protein
MTGFAGTNLIMDAVPDKYGERERQSRAGIGFAKIFGKKGEKFNDTRMV